MLLDFGSGALKRWSTLESVIAEGLADELVFFGLLFSGVARSSFCGGNTVDEFGGRRGVIPVTQVA